MKYADCGVFAAYAGVQIAFLLLAAYLGLSTAQEEGDVRLIGPTYYRGTVAVYHNGEWGTICDDRFDSRDADTICRQLGFERASRYRIRAFYGEGPGPIHIDEMRCPADAKTILDCTPEVKDWGKHDCAKREDAGVDCHRPQPSKPREMPIKLSCPDLEINGPIVFGSCNACPTKQHPSPEDCYPQAMVEGIVFAYFNNNWKPVTGDEWTLREAEITCKELGYPLAMGIPTLQELWANWNGSLNECGESESGCEVYYSGDQIRDDNEYRQTLTETILKKVHCEGKENRLLDCYFPEFGPHKNPSMKVATVRCGFKPHSSCGTNATEIYRLRGAPMPWEGRVEVRVNGTWGTVCQTEWDTADASIVCRAMGYGSVKYVYHWSYFGRGAGVTHYSYLKCNGSEELLQNCKDKATGYRAAQCRPGNDAGVLCAVPSMCTKKEDSAVRLIDLPHDYYPGYNYTYVQIKGNSGWGIICSSAFPEHAANVVCRSIDQKFAGYMQSGLAKEYNGVRYNGRVFCTGDEESIEDCGMFLFPSATCSSGRGYAINSCGTILPDLVPDLKTVANSLRYHPYIIALPQAYLTCALEEGCLSSSAIGKPLSDVRRLLRFDTLTMNLGTREFTPHTPRSKWQFHTCHNHYHSFEAFINYDLLNATTGARVAEGHKASFCLEDSTCSPGYSARYRCASGYQGISVNCGDLYGSHLDCQWIDITDVPLGTYTLRLRVNPDYLVLESDYKNNEVRCLLEIIPDDRYKYMGCSLSDH